MWWELVREVDADSNVFDRYWDAAHGAAVVYKEGPRLFGFANGVPWEVREDVPGNVQAARIRPEAGQWWLYIYVDPRDGKRAEWKVPVLAL